MKKHYFIFTNAPNYPCIITAIFPEEMETQAIDMVKDNCYLMLRTADWEGFGKLPEINQTKHV